MTDQYDLDQAQFRDLNRMEATIHRVYRLIDVWRDARETFPPGPYRMALSACLGDLSRALEGDES